MRYLKMLGLAAVTALAMMALLGTGSASAAVLCEEWANPCPEDLDYHVSEPVHSTLEPETSVEFLTTGEELLYECTGSTIKGEVAETGGLNKPTAIKNTSVYLRRVCVQNRNRLKRKILD